MQKRLFYVLAWVFIISCQRDINGPAPNNPTNPPSKKCRLVKLIQGTHNGAGHDSTFTFDYDASGKMTKINYQNPGYNENKDIMLSYDDSGRLVNVGSFASNAFKYTTNSMLSEIKFSKSDTSWYRFEYGLSALPQKCIRYRLNPLINNYRDTTEYRYTFQNGNMMKRETYSKGVLYNTDYFEYDTIPNVDKNLNLMSHFNGVPLGLFEEFLCFNKNMLRKVTRTNDAYYIYYNMDSGRISRSVQCWLKSPTYTDTTQRDTRAYFYECN